MKKLTSKDYEQIGIYIYDLGDNFRGLRRSLVETTTERKFLWSVTLLDKDGEMVETDYFFDPKGALKRALDLLK